MCAILYRPAPAQGGVIRGEDRLHALYLLRVQALLPTGLLRKGEQHPVLRGGWLEARRFPLQHIRKIGHPFQIGGHIFPFHGRKEILHPLLQRLLIPFALLSLLQDVFIPQEQAGGCLVEAQIVPQVWLDAALGGIDLEPDQNGQQLRVYGILLLQIPFIRFVIRDQPPAQRLVADLPDTGGERAFDRFHPSLPVVGIRIQRLCRRDLQNRQIVPGVDTVHQQRFRDGLHIVAVVVRATQPLRDQGARVDHHHIPKMGQIPFPQGADILQRRRRYLLVAGDMGAAKQQIPLLNGVGRRWRIDRVPLQALPAYGVIRGGPPHAGFHHVHQQAH